MTFSVANPFSRAEFGLRFGPGFFLVVVGLAPYGALTWLPARNSDGRAIAAGFVLTGLLDFVSGLGAVFPGSSTDAVSLVVVPIFCLVVVVPAVAFVSRLLAGR